MKNIILLFLLINTTATAQYKDYVWCFGDSAGIDFSNAANPNPFKSQIKSPRAFTSIADTNGTLIYYIGANLNLAYDHVKIFNNNNAVIQNGDSIINSLTYKITSVQFPNIKNRFIVFTNAKFGNIDGMYYSVFEMDSTNQNGTVLIKNNFILPYIGMPLATVRHANGRDWWVVRLSYFQLNAGLDFLLVTDTGIAGPFTQNLNSLRSFSNLFLSLRFNNKGTELVYTTWAGIIEKYDFDRCTGILSNKVVISTEKPFNQPPGYVSACFSPNDSLLYITSDSIIGTTGGNNLYQINLSSQPLTLDSIYHFSQPVTVEGMNLAADNKIYITAPSLTPYYPYADTDYTFYNTHLSVINQPNMPGQFCDLQPYSFYLGGNRTYWDLPNNANYNLGALVGSICDTLTTAIAPVNAQDAAGLNLTYINQWQKLYVNATKLHGKKCTVKICAVNGSLIYQNTTLSNPPFFTTEINCSTFSSGMYILNLSTELETVSAKFVKQ